MKSDDSLVVCVMRALSNMVYLSTLGKFRHVRWLLHD